MINIKAKNYNEYVKKLFSLFPEDIDTSKLIFHRNRNYEQKNGLMVYVEILCIIIRN